MLAEINISTIRVETICKATPSERRTPLVRCDKNSNLRTEGQRYLLCDANLFRALDPGVEFESDSINVASITFMGSYLWRPLFNLNIYPIKRRIWIC